MDAAEYTAQKLNDKDTKIISRLGLGDTEQALELTADYISAYRDLFADWKEKLKSDVAFRGKIRYLQNLEPDSLAVLSINAAISSLGVDSPTLTSTLRYIGQAAFYECYGHALRSFDTEQAEALIGRTKRANSSLKHRRRGIRGLAKHIGFSFEDWSDAEKLTAGRRLLEVLLLGPMFALGYLDDQPYLVFTEEAYSQLRDIIDAITIKRIKGVPQTGDLMFWESSVLHIDNMPYSLIRSYQKPVRNHVDRALKAGKMAMPLQALNHIQSVKWRINEEVLEVVEQAYELGLTIEGLPSKADLPAPLRAKDWEAMSDNERYAWRRKAKKIKIANISLEGERIVLNADLSMAHHLKGSPFWTPMNFDYRGRVYGIPHFNFQRQDHVRALFMFDQGQVLNAEGLYWLKVHLANCGDFEKVSKKTFDERVWWVDDNLERILSLSLSPLDYTWWTEADKPFLFLAACFGLRDALDGKPVHVPCSHDGSCSGLQHLAAASRCEKTAALVNLVFNKSGPQDIYQTVADLVKTKAQEDLISNDTFTFKNEKLGTERVVRVADLARLLLDNGVTRKLCKRNTMTFSYSSKRSGMQDQILEDTMRPLALQVLSGELEKHPYGDDGGYAAARYLSGLTYSSIVETVEKPAEVMRFLQSIARVMAHEGKPVTWTTPIGFPVMLRLPNTELARVNMFLHDRGVNIRYVPGSLVETSGINKSKAASAIAPSVVHSWDATHLMMVVLAAKQEHINSIALVHDSFGCLPNDVARFREIIKRTFVELYESHDVLMDIWQENNAHLETHNYRMPVIPKRGKLDVQEVLSAEYSFA